MISQRANKFFDTPSIIFAAHEICSRDPFDLKTNPNGYLNLGTAENNLAWDLLKTKLHDCQLALESDCHYAPVQGIPELREAVSKFLNRTLNADTKPSEFLVSNGSTAVIDLLAYALCEEGESMLVPTPYYPGFDIDLKARSRVEIIPAACHSQNDFRLTLASLENARQQAQMRKHTPRAILLTSPGNPVSRLLRREELLDTLKFAKQHDLQCLVDEVYIHSCFPEVTPASAFTFLSQHPEYADRLHIIYSASKDFALGGYRLGFFFSQHKPLFDAMTQLNYFHSTSAHTQRLFTNLLSDEVWVDKYLSQNKARLQMARRHFEREFESFATIAPADSGFLGWINLSTYLAEQSFAAETALHQEIITNAKVNILPGQGFHFTEPGWFRVCYAHPTELVSEGAQRIQRLLASSNQSPQKATGSV